MSKIRYIQYIYDDIKEILSGFQGEKGFIGEFPFVRGHFYGVVDAPLTSKLDPRYGYVASSLGKIPLLLDLVGRLREKFSNIEVLIQDVWARPEDYDSDILSSLDYIKIKNSIYVKTIKEKDQSIVDSIEKIVSAMAVLIFIMDMEEPITMDCIINKSCAVAIEAFDGQGWLLWVLGDINLPS